ASKDYGYASKLYDYHQNPQGKVPDDVVNPNRFNIRVRDAQKGRLGQKWGEKVKATAEEVAGYNEKEYAGKMAPVAESLNSPRARQARPGYDAQAKFYSEGGKNPGDVTDEYGGKFSDQWKDYKEGKRTSVGGEWKAGLPHATH